MLRSVGEGGNRGKAVEKKFMKNLLDFAKENSTLLRFIFVFPLILATEPPIGKSANRVILNLAAFGGSARRGG
jgi:hypothetical protein